MNLLEYDELLLVGVQPGVFVEPSIMLNVEVRLDPEKERLLVLDGDVVYEAEVDGVTVIVQVPISKVQLFSEKLVTVFRQWARGALKRARQEVSSIDKVVFRPFSELAKLKVFPTDGENARITLSSFTSDDAPAKLELV